MTATTRTQTASTESEGGACSIPVPLEVAQLIRDAFLPRNLNRMLGADPRDVEAAKEFIRLVETAAK